MAVFTAKANIRRSFMVSSRCGPATQMHRELARRRGRRARRGSNSGEPLRSRGACLAAISSRRMEPCSIAGCSDAARRGLRIHVLQHQSVGARRLAQTHRGETERGGHAAKGAHQARRIEEDVSPRAKNLKSPCSLRKTHQSCRRSIWRMSGQNSLAMLLTRADSICAPQSLAVCLRPRSCGG